MSDLEKRLFILEAKDEIRQKLYAYARSDDRQDVKLGKSIFTKNAYVDYGTSPERGVIYKGNGQKWIEKTKKLTNLFLRYLAIIFILQETSLSMLKDIKLDQKPIVSVQS